MDQTNKQAKKTHGARARRKVRSSASLTMQGWWVVSGDLSGLVDWWIGGLVRRLWTRRIGGEEVESFGKGNPESKPWLLRNEYGICLSWRPTLTTCKMFGRDKSRCASTDDCVLRRFSRFSRRWAWPWARAKVLKGGRQGGRSAVTCSFPAVYIRLAGTITGVIAWAVSLMMETASVLTSSLVVRPSSGNE